MDIIDKKKTHLKGLLGELGFIYHLIENGWHIFTPTDPNSRIDLIAEKNNIFKKIQVKYCTPYRGCLRIDLERPMRRTGIYTKEEIDDIGVFDSINKRFYLIPLSDILPRKEIWLRVDNLTKGKIQEKNIHWAKQYEI
jgi:hypothetical protein